LEALLYGDDSGGGGGGGAFDHGSGNVGERADERDGVDAGGEWKHGRALYELVLEEDEGFFRGLADERAVRGNGCGDFGSAGVGMFEEAEREFDAQDAADGFVHDGHGDLAGADEGG